jgi:hypothetical protein
MEKLLSFLPQYTIIGPSIDKEGTPFDPGPTTDVQVKNGKRALCTTMQVGSFNDDDSDVYQTARTDGAKLLKDHPYTFSVKECAKLCDEYGEKCSHWSLSLGPAWNQKQAKNAVRDLRLRFTPPAGEGEFDINDIFCGLV